MRVAFIGCGTVAQLHAPIVERVEDARLVCVADINASRAKTFALAHGIEAWYEDFEEMLEQQRPDVAHVLVPPALHADVAAAAIERGAHVLVEKPFTTDANEAGRLTRSAERAGLKICVNHNYLFEQVVKRARELVEKGAVGEIVSVEASFQYDLRRSPSISAEDAEFAHWSYRLNGGPLQDLFSHPASFVISLLGPVEEVQCVRLNRGALPDGFDDEIRIVAKAEQKLGIIDVSFNARPEIVTFRVKGSEGVLTVDLFANDLTLRRSSGLPRAIERGLSGVGIGLQRLLDAGRNAVAVASGHFDQTIGKRSLIEGFYRSVSEGKAPPVPPDEGVHLVELMEMIWPEPSRGSQRAREQLAQQIQASGTPEILLTGASGFIGSHLQERLLKEGRSIRSFVRPGSPRAGRVRRRNVEFFSGDLRDKQALREAVRGVKTVYHLGGPTGGDADEHEKATVQATATLVEAALEYDAESFVYVSTLGVVDILSSQDQGVITEEAEYAKVLSPYAEAKMRAEKLVLEGCEKGLHATIIRPGLVVGPRGGVVFPRIAYSYKDRVFILLGKGDHVLPLSYVDNTVLALRQASRCGTAGAVYHIVDDAVVTAKEYVHLLTDVSELDSRIVHCPYPLAYAGAAAVELAGLIPGIPQLVASRRLIARNVKSVIVDNSKAKAELGWEPEVPMEAGLRRTFEWYGKTRQR